MILTNLNAISRYERMRRRQRPVVADVEDAGNVEQPELVEDDDGTRGVRVEQRRKGEAARRRFSHRRTLLAPERRRWPRGGNGNRELGRIVDTYA